MQNWNDQEEAWVPQPVKAVCVMALTKIDLAFTEYVSRACGKKI